MKEKERKKNKREYRREDSGEINVERQRLRKKNSIPVIITVPRQLQPNLFVDCSFYFHHLSFSIAFPMLPLSYIRLTRENFPIRIFS